MATVDAGEADRERMAYQLAPVLKQVVDASGAYQTLFDAHACLVDQKSQIQMDLPRIHDVGAAAGVIIIIRS
jgi:hypothetical protein